MTTEEIVSMQKEIASEMLAIKERVHVNEEALRVVKEKLHVLRSQLEWEHRLLDDRDQSAEKGEGK